MYKATNIVIPCTLESDSDQSPRPKTDSLKSQKSCDVSSTAAKEVVDQKQTSFNSPSTVVSDQSTTCCVKDTFTSAVDTQAAVLKDTAAKGVTFAQLVSHNIIKSLLSSELPLQHDERLCSQLPIFSRI